MNLIAPLRRLLEQGLALGEPRACGGLTLVPLFGGVLGGDYMLAADALGRGLLEIDELGEGAVPSIVAHNRAPVPVLLLGGEHLTGAKQSRILNVSVLLPASRSTVVPVACVEQGRWHFADRETFSASAEIAYPRLRRLQVDHAGRSLRAHRVRHVSQTEVWRDLAGKHVEAGVGYSATGAMSDAFDHRRAHVEESMHAFPRPQPGQTGVIACVGAEFVAVDAFDRPETLAGLWVRLGRGYAMDALGAPNPGIEEGAPARFLAEAARADATMHPGVGEGHDVVLSSPSVVGNALIWGGGVVHLSLFPSNGGAARRTGGHIATPAQRSRARAHFHGAHRGTGRH